MQLILKINHKQHTKHVRFKSTQGMNLVSIWILIHGSQPDRNEVVEKTNEYRKSLSLTLTDREKAFDLVEIVAVLSAIKQDVGETSFVEFWRT